MAKKESKSEPKPITAKVTKPLAVAPQPPEAPRAPEAPKAPVAAVAPSAPPAVPQEAPKEAPLEFVTLLNGYGAARTVAVGRPEYVKLIAEGWVHQAKA
jgi:hypothetical protein